MSITGLGGIGKTQLLLELLYQMKLELRNHIVIWIQATSKESLEQGLLRAATHLNLPASKITDPKEMVRDHLSGDKTRKWQLIFDNADDIIIWTDAGPGSLDRLLDILPTSKEGSIIFTTRNRKAAINFAGRNIVFLSSIDELNSIQLFAGYMTDQSALVEQQEDAKALVSQLAYLPLAIVKAASYIESDRISLKKYLSLIEVQEESFLALPSEDFEADARYSTMKNPVATSWLISFRQIQENNSLAAEHLSFMGCVDSKDILLSMLPPGRSPKERTDAIGTLHAYSFITKQASNSTITLHRLVHLVTRSWLRQEHQFLAILQIATATLSDLMFYPDGAKKRSLEIFCVTRGVSS